jgi:hypothetical protein
LSTLSWLRREKAIGSRISLMRESRIAVAWREAFGINSVSLTAFDSLRHYTPNNSSTETTILTG